MLNNCACSPISLGFGIVESNSNEIEKMIQEKLEKSLAFKDEGNNLYKAKEYKKAMRKYHNAILYLKGIDNDLHGTPAFLQSASVDPNSGNYRYLLRKTLRLIICLNPKVSNNRVHSLCFISNGL